MTDEHFIVWMRTSGLPVFRKLWGRVDRDLEQGDYYVKIGNNYETKTFLGQKILVMSTLGDLGGKNVFLAYMYIVVGCACLTGSLGFLLKIYRARNKKTEDEKVVPSIAQ